MRPAAQDKNALASPLDDLLGSEAGVRLLRLLADEVAGPVNASEAARRAGLTVPGSRKALERLVRTGFVVEVGGGRAKQYALKCDEPLVAALEQLFAAERMRYQSWLGELRTVFQGVTELRAAWIEHMPGELGEPVEIGVFVDAGQAPSIREELRTRVSEVERRSDQVIEVTIHTLADLPAPDPRTTTLLAGMLPVEIGVSSRNETRHAERDLRALRLSEGLSAMVRRDPSLIKRALSHVERILQTDQGTAAGDLFEWRQVLEAYSARRLQDFLVSESSRARRLRQSSPFFAILTADERDWLMAHYGENR